MPVTTRAAVYAAIDTERDYQARRWPGQEFGHAPAAWLLFLERHLEEAKRRVYDLSPTQVQEELRKIAALAVAALEEHGAPVRRP